ncbi:HAD-IIA family hydrolase [Cribrihabitans neustonicus]|uniref:HAD-IIA family hydrolase n=1 Tax=Cribrihabitans neustonicus TaxID=1429085 RepID=UPI003B5C7D13
MINTSSGAPLDADWAFERYEALRPQLPRAEYPASSRAADDLSGTADHFDGYILDAFGVLNRGETAIEGAVARMAWLRGQGKRLVVLTNAASYTKPEILAKYHRLGFDFTASEVVSSRDIAFAALPRLPAGLVWAAAAAEGDDFSDAPDPGAIAQLADDPSLWNQAGGFLLLSTARWREADTARLAAALRANPRPLIVANPDLAAPREAGLSPEPGYAAQEVAAQTGAGAQFYGKPFGNAFSAALALMGDLPRHRIAMVGDTLHTDVLGGAAAGIGTVLITGHGLFRGRDVAPFIARSGIRPHWIVPTT